MTPPVTSSPATLEAALRYVQRGWPLIDGVYGIGPRDTGWSSRAPITTESAARDAFGGELRQVSLWTGALVDLDLDCHEAVRLAPAYLPATASVWGRPGNPRSHCLYRVDQSTSVLKFMGPDARVLLEVRGRGSNAISALPPSKHGSGELYHWHEDSEPARVAWDDLVRAAKTLAAATLFLRAWPEAGGRNECAKHVAGMLAHGGWTQDPVVRFLRPILEAAGDDVEERLRDAVVHTVRQHERGQPVTGTPALAKLLGSPVVDRARDWLALNGESESAGPVSRNHPGDELIFTPAAELLAEPDEAHQWVVEGQLKAGGFGLLVGYPKAGKSVTLLNLALAVARGEKFLGRFPTTSGAVYVLAHEGSRQEIKDQWRRMGLTTEPVYIAFVPHLQAGVVKLKVAMVRATTLPALIIIDPLFKFIHVKDVNDYAQVSAALAPLFAFAQASHIAILAAHHTGKGERTTGQEALGSTGIIGAADMMWVQKRYVNEAGEVLYRTLRGSEYRGFGQSFPEQVLVMDEATCRLTIAGTRAETEEATVADRILTALGRQSDGMLRSEIEEAAGVRTALVRPLLRAMVERGEVRVEVQPGSARAKRYFRGAYTLVRTGTTTASDEGEQATVGRGQDGKLLGCSLSSVPTENNRADNLFPLVRTEIPLVPAVVPAREQATDGVPPGTSESAARDSVVQATIDLFDGEIVPALVKTEEARDAA